MCMCELYICDVCVCVYVMCVCVMHCATAGNTPHQVLIHYGLGDAQVSWLGAHIEARSVTQGGAFMYRSNVREGNETLYGFDFIDSDDTVEPGGNAIQGYDWGAPVAPFVNRPPSKATDAHEKPRRDPRAQEMMNLFFRTGQVKNECAGPCVNKTKTLETETKTETETAHM